MSSIELTSNHDSATAFGGELSQTRGNEIRYPLGYMPALDGSRGIMAFGVLACHTKPIFFAGAVVFMDIFFTMSGYLITSLLIKDYKRHGRIDLKIFYIRRALRLYPALVSVVGTILLFSLIFPSDLVTRLMESAAALLYLSDYWFLLQWPSKLYTSHMWSVSVEEQFYMIWPMVFIGILRLTKLTFRAFFLVAAIFLVCWGWRILATVSGVQLVHLYNAFDTRADSFVVGCGLAILLGIVDLSRHPKIVDACKDLLGPIALFMLCLVPILNPGVRWYYCVSAVMICIPTAIGIIGLHSKTQTFTKKVFEFPIFVFVGRICYSLYLWHYPIFLWIDNWSESAWVKLFVGWPLAFSISIVSHYYIERPFMRARPAFG